jgi:hypothetical protein
MKQTRQTKKLTTFNPSIKLSMSSYSPLVNKRLLVHSLKTSRVNSIKLCDSLLYLQIKTKKCQPYNSTSIKKLLLDNLRSSKHLDVSRFIPPIQLLSNCWFNTMFVTFFFSDKGRKFFRFFRELMITGRKLDNSPIPTNIAKILFILNLFIEASYNQTTKSHDLFKTFNQITDKLNTNFFIYHLHQIITNHPEAIQPNSLFKNDNKVYDIPNIDDAGNPLAYYESILKYLKYNILQIMKQTFLTKVNVFESIQKKFNRESLTLIPDIIILQDLQSTSLYEPSYTFTDIKKNTYTYVLDSIILTNKDHFDPKANSHFVSVLTCNKEEYKFDGSSLSKLEKFKWKKLINTNKDWNFKEDPKYEPEVYNFTKGYKILFYYRI